MDVNSKMGSIRSPDSGTQTERDARPGFRAGVVGSNPAGPTIFEKIHALSTKIILK